MKLTPKSLVLALACLGTGSVPAWAGIADAASGVIRVMPGQNPAATPSIAALRQHFASMHRAWLAAHPGQASVNPPQLVAGTVLSPTNAVGKPASVPVLSFSYLSPAGLNGVSFVFSAPAGGASNNVNYYQGSFAQSGTITFSGNAAAPLYSAPGTWVLTQAFVSDLAGNFTQYDQAQLATLFKHSSYTLINNGPVDTTPPVVTAGTLVTPSVSLSAPYPQFVATLTGTDNLSGLGTGYVYIQAPGAPYSLTTTSYFSFPVKSGTLSATVPIFAGSVTGTYTISGYELCDVVGNCFSDQTPADIVKLFGTNTFTVTN
ncbi:MAG: hypothetical protein POG24_09345 [Acidocella sp.]|nr:hypothetical protein [Acidocella sp.]